MDLLFLWKKKKKEHKNIPVISRLQRAVNINNSNVQVESVGLRFPHALRATWERHASVREPTRGTSLFQICVTAFAYISILSCFSLLSLLCVFYFFPSLWTPVQISRTTVLSWSSGSLVTDTHTQDWGLCWWIEPPNPIMIDHVWDRMTECAVGVALMKSVRATTLAASYSLLCFQWHPVSACFRPIWLDWHCSFSFSNKHFELYICKYC